MHFLKKIVQIFWRYENSPYICTRNQEMIDASLAQLVEHDTLNVGVQGSSPWGGTKENLSRLLERFFVFIPLPAIDSGFRFRLFC